ncbi:MAG: hypoxanthine phosphoribosyltransferase [Acidobacteriota bacterium]|jgi:hypoxanthine phosphoribosyltransferase
MKLADGILLTENQIQQRVSELARRIENDYAGKTLYLCGVLKGSIPFLADLMRGIRGDVRLALIEMKSEVDGKHAKILFTSSLELKDRHVLIVEDIVDTGITLDYLIKHLEAERAPASIKVATLLDKPSARKLDVPIAYRGFNVPDRFLVGYGLDSEEKYRNLPYISWVEPE